MNNFRKRGKAGKALPYLLRRRRISLKGSKKRAERIFRSFYVVEKFDGFILSVRKRDRMEFFLR